MAADELEDVELVPSGSLVSCSPTSRVPHSQTRRLRDEQAVEVLQVPALRGLEPSQPI